MLGSIDGNAGDGPTVDGNSRSDDVNNKASNSVAKPPRNWNTVIRVAVFLACLLPFVALVRAVAINSLGPDPAEHLMHVTGEWVMRFLLLVLLATPLARNGWPRLARTSHARTLCLVLRDTAPVGIRQVLSAGQEQLVELADRPYVLVGFWLG